MRRYATYMLVKPGMEAEYVERHRNCWPGIIEGAQQAGIRNYTIFMRGRELLSYFETEDLTATMAQIAADPVNQRWQSYMAPLMDIGAGVREGSTLYLEEVFHTDGAGDVDSTRRRVATFMRVREGMEERYRQAHRAVWPEVLEGIARVGIANYSIFMRGRELYSYFEIGDLDYAMAILAADADNQRWQAFMAPVMDLGSGIKDGSTAYLTEVFRID